MAGISVVRRVPRYFGSEADTQAFRSGMEVRSTRAGGEAQRLLFRWWLAPARSSTTPTHARTQRPLARTPAPSPDLYLSLVCLLLSLFVGVGVLCSLVDISKSCRTRTDLSR